MSELKFQQPNLSASAPASSEPSIWNREIELVSPFGMKEKQNFYDMLGMLLSSGLGIIDALGIVEEQSRKKKVKAIMAEIIERLKEGFSLSECLEQQEKYFSTFEMNSIQMGELSGRLKEVLEELSRYYESRLRLRRKLLQVASYPIMVITIAIGVVYFMIGKVVPMFENVFKQFDAKLPPLTQSIIDFSEFLEAYGLYLLLGVGLFILLFIRIRKTLIFQRISSSILIRIPLIGQLILKIQLARLSITMATLLKSKVKLDEALKLVQEIVSFYPIQAIIPNIRTQITEGSSLYDAIRNESIFPSFFKQMVRVGEETASLDVMFERLGRNLDQESEAQVSSLTNILEPILVVILAIIVGVILIAMYMPMFQLSQNIGV